MTKHEVEVPVKELIGFALVFLIMILALIIGYFVYEEKPTNCWQQYQTEQQAIQNCEQH